MEIVRRAVDGKFETSVIPLLFGRARVTIAHAGDYTGYLSVW